MAVVVATMVMILVSDQHLQILLVDLLVFSELELYVLMVENLVKRVARVVEQGILMVII